MKPIVLFFIAIAAICQGCNSHQTKTDANPTIYAMAEVSDTLWTDTVKKTDEEWRASLTSEQYRILRQKGTERSFTSPLLHVKEDGHFACAACGNPLFTTETKFESGTGWPSFYAPSHSRAVKEIEDTSYGMRRVEIVCARCDGHLGHVFTDGPDPTGLRYCMNGEALQFTAEKDAALKGQTATAYFAQGCFWCLEEIFEAVKGVKEVVSGYSGGSENTTNYKQVSSGSTRHAEAIQVMYNPNEISFDDLLKVYFNAGDITQVNGQGPDRGSQYRSIAFYTNDAEKKSIATYIERLKASKKYTQIAVEVQPFEKFIPAEDYHQDFVKRNPNQGYVLGVSKPRFEKAIKNFPELLKK